VNAKAVKLARRVNRDLGTLGKRECDPPLPHKVPRGVKRAFAALSHKKRGRMTAHWLAKFPPVSRSADPHDHAAMVAWVAAHERAIAGGGA
jgi:hypothetical protein